jgi:hypothetical protein
MFFRSLRFFIAQKRFFVAIKKAGARCKMKGEKYLDANLKAEILYSRLVLLLPW